MPETQVGHWKKEESIPLIVGRILEQNPFKHEEIKNLNVNDDLESTVHHYWLMHRAHVEDQKEGLYVFTDVEGSPVLEHPYKLSKETVYQKTQIKFAYAFHALILNEHIILKEKSRFSNFWNKHVLMDSLKGFYRDIQASDVGKFLKESSSYNPISFIVDFNGFEENFKLTPKVKWSSKNWLATNKLFLATGAVLPDKENEQLIKIEEKYNY